MEPKEARTELNGLRARFLHNRPSAVHKSCRTSRSGLSSVLSQAGIRPFLGHEVGTEKIIDGIAQKA